MGKTGPVNPAPAGQPPGLRPGGSLAAAARDVVRTPLSARAGRELLFCVAEVPLGLSALAFPAALAGLPLVIMLLVQGGGQPARRSHAHPAGLVMVLGGAIIIVVLLGLLLLIPRLARVRAAGWGPRCATAPAGGPRST